MTFTILAARTGAFAAAAGAAILMASTPVLATTHPVGTKPDADHPQQQFEIKRDGKGHVKYCAKLEQVTGSIMSVKKCQTAERWKADGVDLNIDGN